MSLWAGCLIGSGTPRFVPRNLARLLLDDVPAPWFWGNTTLFADHCTSLAPLLRRRVSRQKRAGRVRAAGRELTSLAKNPAEKPRFSWLFGGARDGRVKGRRDGCSLGASRPLLGFFRGAENAPETPLRRTPDPSGEATVRPFRGSGKVAPNPPDQPARGHPRDVAKSTRLGRADGTEGVERTGTPRDSRAARVRRSKRGRP